MQKEQFENTRNRIIAIMQVALEHRLNHVLRARRKELKDLLCRNPEWIWLHKDEDDFLMRIDIDKYANTQYANEVRIQHNMNDIAMKAFNDNNELHFCKECTYFRERGCANLCNAVNPPKSIEPLREMKDCIAL